MPKKKYLVIKHGALGDFILACGPFAAIRRRHPKSHIVLLTTAPYKALAESSPYFDEVWVDEKAKPTELAKGWALIKRLREAQFKMVYDLQTSTRSSWYFRLIGRRKPLWSGIVDWCSHPHLNPKRIHMHTLDRQAEQLRLTKIKYVPKPKLDWLTGDISAYGLPDRFALLVPGGSAHRPEKRWSVEGFAKLGRFLRDRGITPVCIGTAAERAEIEAICRLCDGARSLCERTSFGQIAELARNAALAVGNDTGPMHIIAYAQCPTIVLFSEASDPQKCAPIAPKSRYLQEENLKNLPADHVISLAEEMLEA